MILGESFDFEIMKVLREEPLRRVVRVRLVRDYWDGQREVTVGFFPAEWARYKSKGSYPESRALTPEMIAYYEDMPLDQWCKARIEPNLIDFSDEEIVEEFNRRMKDRIFHHVGLESRAVITTK